MEWGKPEIWRLPHGHISWMGAPGLTGRVLRWLSPRLSKPVSHSHSGQFSSEFSLAPKVPTERGRRMTDEDEVHVQEEIKKYRTTQHRSKKRSSFWTNVVVSAASLRIYRRRARYHSQASRAARES